MGKHNEAIFKESDSQNILGDIQSDNHVNVTVSKQDEPEKFAAWADLPFFLMRRSEELAMEEVNKFTQRNPLSLTKSLVSVTLPQQLELQTLAANFFVFRNKFKTAFRFDGVRDRPSVEKAKVLIQLDHILNGRVTSNTGNYSESDSKDSINLSDKKFKSDFKQFYDTFTNE